MNTDIFYFSATGNSLDFAKKLANKLNTKSLNSISKLINEESVITKANRIGIICPVYAWGLPRIVKDFLEKLQLQGNPYVFAIVSCVGIPGKTLKEIQHILQKNNFDLSAGFVIKSPCSSLAKKNALDNIVIGMDRKRKHLKTGEERIDEIFSVIENYEIHKAETSSGVANYFSSIFHNYGMDFFKKASMDFEISDSCSGCGNCVRVCPRANIKIEEGSPVFSDNCEFCHACIQWCPHFAIKHPNFDKTLNQYRNPNIDFNDIIVNI